LINNFKSWFTELGGQAISRKNAIALKTGKRPKWTNTVKNREIKEKFSVDGRRLEGIKPRSSADRKAREWLYDLIWREFDSENNFIGVKLVMEIEFSDMKENGLVYDFNKLVQSDSEYKIFVFQQQNKEKADNAFKQFRSRSEFYNHKMKSQFLLSCWCWDSGTFIFNEFSSQVSA
tara:strand:- start:31 stop:558 length:528 start_codon:yes stop_codon:yes gene_type:complete